jgi:YesN/AraC family two-component response regulator
LLEMNYGVQRAGANDYLPKPVTRESIQKILGKIPS